MPESVATTERAATAKIAWAVTVTTGLGAATASQLSGPWAAEAFEMLGLATLFYGATGVFYFLAALVPSLATRSAAPPSQAAQTHHVSKTQIQLT